MLPIIEKDETIDSILNVYKTDLGHYYEPYKNHVYRVFNFAVSSINSKEDLQKLAIAAAFHDIGIWTNSTFDYLQPSIKLARNYCLTNELTPETTAEIELMIDDHHKLNKVTTSALAELFRQADLVDLSLGLIGNGHEKEYIKAVRNKFENKGFHWFLVKAFLKNLVKNPLNPLPVVKF
ncbi:hypothetical protein [Solitalea canadensis]|nr:hypothetical protein [Solitalea canadensis]